MSENRFVQDRRSFLTGSFGGLVSAAFTGFDHRRFMEKRLTTGPVITRPLGNTGIEIPVVSMGVSNPLPEIIRAAYERGVCYFSTGHWYHHGLCEQAIGDVVADLGIRDRVILGTKVPTGMRRDGSWGEDVAGDFLGRVALSMERLRTDTLDILYLYNVRDTEELSRPELLESLIRLKREKTIRAAGFSTHTNNPELLYRAADLPVYDVICTALNYTMSDEREFIGALGRLYEKGRGIVAMKTQCGGAWSVDGYRKPREQPKNQAAMLKWVLRHPFVATAIPAMDAFDHVDENFSVAAGLDYTPEEIRFLEDENIKLSIGFCRSCRTCMVSCPNSVEIPSLMRTYMYAYGYRNTDLVRVVDRESGLSESLSVCRDCGTCRARCVRGFPVRERIEALTRLNGGVRV